MKTKLLHKWLSIAADYAMRKTFRKKFVELLLMGNWVEELECRAMHKCGLAFQYWRSDTNGMASAFKQKYAKYSRRYYDDDNVLKRIIETGHED